MGPHQGRTTSVSCLESQGHPLSRVYPDTQRLKVNMQALSLGLQICGDTAPIHPPKETRVDIPVSESPCDPLHRSCSMDGRAEVVKKKKKK